MPGKLTSALSKAGRGNGAVQRYQDPAEIRLRPCFDPQPFQPPTHLNRRDIFKQDRAAALAEWRQLAA